MKTLAILLALLASAATAFPCSIFKYSVDGRTYFCGNEDWSATDPAMQACSPKGGDYGYVLLGWRSFLPRYIQAGINSKGLCFDWAAVPPQPYVRDDVKDDLGLDFTRDVLRRCANVEEAVAFIRHHNIAHLAQEHIMFADSSGKSCIVEYNNSRLHIQVDESRAQFMTNFHVTDKSLGWYPCARYAKMEAFFREAGNKEARLVELLDSIHQEGQYPTVYSYVFDLGRKRITVFHNHNFHSGRTFELQSLMETDRVLSISFQAEPGSWPTAVAGLQVRSDEIPTWQAEAGASPRIRPLFEILQPVR